MFHNPDQLLNDLQRLWKFDQTVTPSSFDEIFTSIGEVASYKFMTVLLLKTLTVAYGFKGLPSIDNFDLWNITKNEVKSEDDLLESLYEYANEHVYPYASFFEALDCPSWNCDFTHYQDLASVSEIPSSVYEVWKELWLNIDFLFDESYLQECYGYGEGYLIYFKDYEKIYQSALNLSDQWNKLMVLCKDVIERTAGYMKLITNENDWWLAFYFISDDEGNSTTEFTFAQSMFFAVFCMNCAKEFLLTKGVEF